MLVSSIKIACLNGWMHNKRQNSKKKITIHCNTSDFHWCIYSNTGDKTHILLLIYNIIPVVILVFIKMFNVPYNDFLVLCTIQCIMQVYT